MCVSTILPCLICPSIHTSAHPSIHRYDGVACQRTTCPLNCLGRGVCFTEKHFAQKAGRTYDLAWDAYKQVCVCVWGVRAGKRAATAQSLATDKMCVLLVGVVGGVSVRPGVPGPGVRVPGVPLRARPVGRRG